MTMMHDDMTQDESVSEAWVKRRNAEKCHLWQKINFMMHRLRPRKNDGDGNLMVGY